MTVKIDGGMSAGEEDMKPRNVPFGYRKGPFGYRLRTDRVPLEYRLGTDRVPIGYRLGTEILAKRPVYPPIFLHLVGQ